MGRYTGPVCRQCRREGQKLFLKGARCYMAKCPIEQGTGAPGMHVGRRAKKMSEYGSQLRQKQSLRRQYGMGELQFHKFFEEAYRKAGFKGSRKSTAFAATMVAQDAARVAVAKGMHECEVRMQGAGAGRESAVRAIQAAGIRVTQITDTTPVPHNGCRARKRRRV